MPRRENPKDPLAPAISGAPLIDSDRLGWRDLRLTEWQGVAPQEAHEKELSRHLVVVHATAHPVQVFERAEGFRSEVLARPGDVNVLSAGEEALCRWDRPLSFIRVEIPPAFLRTVAERVELPQSDRLQIIHAFHARDGRMLQIIRWMADELRHGGLGGKLYSDALTDLMAVHLLRHYTGTPAGRGPAAPPVPTRKQIARAIDFFTANLDQLVSLNDVAEAAGMSPSRFPRLFKRATGLSPQQTRNDPERRKTMRALGRVNGCCLIGLIMSLTLALPPVLKDARAAEPKSDREEIIAIVNGIGNSADRRDWEACRAFWIEEPFVDYSSLSGQPGARVRADDLIAGWKAFLPKFKFTQHFITNHEIKVSGDRADCRSYVHAIHHLRFAEGGELWGVYGIYEHSLVRKPAGWKVSKMIFRLLAQEGNRGLPALAAKAPDERKVRFSSEGVDLSGVLYVPAGHSEKEKLPAVIVTGSWTTVKEQMAGTYAKKLAAEGLIALAFDFRGFGESGGEPRQYESPAKKVQDIRNAVGFLQTLPVVDREKIGGLGVCASSGYMAEAVAGDKRLKVFASVAPWFHDAGLVRMIYGGEEGVKEKVAAGLAARTKFEKMKVNDLVPACSPTDKQAAMFGSFEYYLSPARGAIPEWKNQFAVMSWPDWLHFDPIPTADRISIPVLLIHSEEAAIPDGAKRFFGKLHGKKELHWLQGTQFDFYDHPPLVNEAARKAALWVKANLNP